MIDEKVKTKQHKTPGKVLVGDLQSLRALMTNRFTKNLKVSPCLTFSLILLTENAVKRL